MKSDLYSLSNSEIVNNLGKRYASYRKRMGFTQREIADQTGLSIFTISTFENGSSSGITLASLLQLLRAIESLEEMEKILPELPTSAKDLFKQKNSKQ